MSLLGPNKADIENYKQAIRDYRTAKVTGPDSIEEYTWAWKEVCRNHFSKLRLDLRHLSDRPLKDSLEADAIGGETLFNIESYFKHYEDWQLSHIAAELNDARKGLDYIEKRLRAERTKRRNKRKPTKTTKILAKN